jgi:hypothetical protein
MMFLMFSQPTITLLITGIHPSPRRIQVMFLWPQLLFEKVKRGVKTHEASMTGHDAFKFLTRVEGDVSQTSSSCLR